MWNKLRERFFGIRRILLLSYLVIILICVAMIGSAAYYISYRSMSDRMETASFQIVRQIENNLDNDLHSKRNLLLAPYYYQEYIDSINAYSRMDPESKFLFRQNIGNLYLKSFNTTPIRDFVRFEIYYSNGELLNDSDNATTATSDQVKNSRWFRKAIERDGKVLIFTPDPFDTSETTARLNGREYAYSTSILIRDFANPKEFVIVKADYNGGLFHAIGQDADLTENSGFLILDENNRTVYVSDSYRSLLSPEMLQRVEGDSGKFWFDQDEGNYLISYTRSSYSNWKTVLLMPEADILSPLNPIKTAMIYTGLFAFFVTSILSVVFGRSITRPILSLYKSVNHMKRGDFSVRVDVKRNDEIGRIAMNFNAMQDELQKLIESKYINQIKLKEVELAMLYSQINPHFLYNTLDSIKAMADYYQAGEVGEMAQSLADMFRYNIKNKDEVVTLREELEQIEAYMKIQGFRFDDKIRFETSVEKELYEYPLLKMTLQPLVENAVFHGMERKRGSGTIRVSASRTAEGVRINVSDDGIGIPPVRLKEIQEAWKQPIYQEDFAILSPNGSGIGIHNVYTRYAIHYGRRVEFQIDSRLDEGTEVTLLIRDENLNLEKHPTEVKSEY